MCPDEHYIVFKQFLVLNGSKESLCSKHASGMYYVRANLPHNMVCSISHWHRMQLHSSLFCFLPAEVLWVVCGRQEAIWQSDGGVHKEAETRSSSDRNRSGWQHLSRQQRHTLQLATVEWTLPLWCIAHADVHTLTQSLLIVVFIVTCMLPGRLSRCCTYVVLYYIW